jgi:hypothetical protein
VTREEIFLKVVTALQHVQARTPGITCIEITGSTRPLEDIEKFDSKRWPTTRNILALELGISLVGENIFRQGRSTPRTVDQIVDRLCEILCCQTSILSAA